MNIRQSAIRQTIVKRKYKQETIDKALRTGFIDYSELKESDEEFIDRVTSEANLNRERIINISYLNEDTAVIVWKDVSYIETVQEPEHNYTKIIDEIRVERYRDSKVTTGSEPYDVFQERVKRLASYYKLASIMYPDQNTAIIRVFE